MNYTGTCGKVAIPRQTLLKIVLEQLSYDSKDCRSFFPMFASFISSVSPIAEHDKTMKLLSHIYLILQPIQVSTSLVMSYDSKKCKHYFKA